MSPSTDPIYEGGAAADAYLLTGDDITVRFGGLTALDRFNIRIPPRTIIGLIGPNGAGKSTAVGVLSGLLTPAVGKVTLGGRDVTQMAPEQRARRGLARTFQHVELFAGLSVREHLVLSWRMKFARQRRWRDLVDARGWRRPPPDESDRVNALLRMLDIEPVANVPIASLPLGTCRLVEVARALAASPRVVLLDEPFAGLDSNESRRLADALDLVVESEHVSLLLIDHDVDTVLARASHIVVLDFGSTIASGPPGRIRTDQRVREAYLGDGVVGVAQEAR